MKSERKAEYAKQWREAQERWLREHGFEDQKHGHWMRDRIHDGVRMISASVFSCVEVAKATGKSIEMICASVGEQLRARGTSKKTIEGFDFVRWLWGSPFDGMIPLLELEHGRLHCNGALLPDFGWADYRDSAWEGDCYFSACSVADTWQARTARGAWRKPSTGEAVAIPALWLDLDPTGPARVPVDQVVRELDKHGLQSLAVVDSGRGVQLWQPLQRPLLCEPTGAACKTLLRRHGEWIAARLPLGELGAKPDSSVWEQSRIMRLPGTRNGKTGELARVVRLGEHLPWEHVLPRVLAPKPIERVADEAAKKAVRLGESIESLRQTVSELVAQMRAIGAAADAISAKDAYPAPDLVWNEGVCLARPEIERGEQ